VGGDIMGGSHSGIPKLVSQGEVGVRGAGELHQTGTQVLRGVLTGDVHERPLRHHRGSGNLESAGNNCNSSVGPLALT
ncbi:hypothetical protein C5L27_13610, partial [Staphylococcus argenteus]